MKAILAALAVMVLAGCDAGTSSTTVAPQSTDPTATAHAKANDGPVVFIGDSITAYWPLDKYFPGAIDAGVVGQTSAQVLARFDDDALALHPSTIVILAGVNDAIQTQSPDASNVFEMVQRAQAAGIRVIVGTIPAAMGALPDVAMAVTGMNQELRQGALTYGYALADYATAMTEPNGSQDYALFEADQLHPDAAGYDAMSAVLRPLLEE